MTFIQDIQLFQGMHGTVIEHRSSFTGNVSIQSGDNKISVPAEDLLEFASRYVAFLRHKEINQADWRKLLLEGVFPSREINEWALIIELDNNHQPHRAYWTDIFDAWGKQFSVEGLSAPDIKFEE